MSAPDTFGLQLAKYTNVAASAILIYDYFVTLHSEVQWTWGRKWGIIRTAFTVSRYVPFAGALLTSYSAVKTWGAQDCAPFNNAVNGIHFLGIIASEGLLIARVYAFSGNKKVYLISLLSFGLVILVTSVILSAAPINSNIPEVAPPSSCAFEEVRGIALPYGLAILFETLLMSVTAFLRYRHYFESHSTLIKSIYRDGLLYMFCITMMSTFNVIVIAALPLSYSETLNAPQVVAHSVLASRILFNLQVSSELPGLPTERLTSSMELLSRPHEFQAWSDGSEMVAGSVQPDWQA
ncbi:hypothetical protein DEU56DRAFT_518830 [Suillus clintonianus]|uniref:uncharacterized protein n=1 Tax=Suillus clintonianus TaxID=1904413 RepID=UPI001B85F9F9|nr:uncharacterized protein DEU56DRAFT_518830 [Suillus clintonianus]KAG2152836.1 hypothetical protein DEU56DRAFT_518830 [Suillus clintonianus]